MSTIVDSNILIDISSNDPKWKQWSYEHLSSHGKYGPLIINPIVYGETSVQFQTKQRFEQFLSFMDFVNEEIPLYAAFLAGKAYKQYKQNKGKKNAILPDFYIGAHAQSKGYKLLTRDAKRYRQYFPDLDLIAPDEA